MTVIPYELPTGSGVQGQSPAGRAVIAGILWFVIARDTPEEHPLISSNEISKIRALIPLLQQQVDMHKTLLDEGYGSKLAYLQALQELVGQQQELAVQRSHYREADAALAAITETQAQAVAEYRHGVLDDLTKAQQKARPVIRQ